jgi:hypothetical protein
VTYLLEWMIDIEMPAAAQQSVDFPDLVFPMNMTAF